VSEILSKIVDAGGLLNAKGLVVYNELEAELQQALKCFTIPPAFITLLYASLLLFVQRIGMLALFNRGIKTLDLSFGSSLCRRYGEAF
jgi:hypothetical protein